MRGGEGGGAARGAGGGDVERAGGGKEPEGEKSRRSAGPPRPGCALRSSAQRHGGGASAAGAVN